MSLLRPAAPRIPDAVAADLEKRILEGSLKSGERLPAERVLAIELGVSRPTLREAIQKLVSRGLLSTRHGGGTVVTDRLEAAFADPWQEMLRGNPLLQHDVMEFRQMLESETAALAADRATDVDLVRLEAAHRRLDESYLSDDLEANIDADAAFHQAVAESAHNALIVHLSASLLRVIHGQVSRNLHHLRQRPQRWGQLRTQHQAIWDAIREHRPVDAAAAARGHIEFARRSLIEGELVQERREAALRRTGESG